MYATGMNEMTVNTLSANVVRDKFGAVLSDAERGRADVPGWIATVVTRDGQPAAVVVNADWFFEHQSVRIPGRSAR